MISRILRGLVAVLAVAGIVVSALALHVHNMDPGLAPPCAVSEHWDCGAVNHSRYAVFPPKSFDEDATSKNIHIPVAAIGIAGYSLIAILALLGRWWMVLQLAEVGFFSAGLLSYLEAFVLQKWCIYCVWSQGLVTAILLLTIVAAVHRHRSRRLVGA
jgi:vitamin-K-epoxide reductase (warfarin-sensitive)